MFFIHILNLHYRYSWPTCIHTIINIVEDATEIELFIASYKSMPICLVHHLAFVVDMVYSIATRQYFEHMRNIRFYDITLTQKQYNISQPFVLVCEVDSFLTTPFQTIHHSHPVFQAAQCMLHVFSQGRSLDKYYTLEYTSQLTAVYLSQANANGERLRRVTFTLVSNMQIASVQLFCVYVLARVRRASIHTERVISLRTLCC